MMDLIIMLEEDGNKGCYVVWLLGSVEEVEMIYLCISFSCIIVDYIGVLDVFKGMGVGKVLVFNIIFEVCLKGFIIVLFCFFLKVQVDCNFDWGDVIEGMVVFVVG